MKAILLAYEPGLTTCFGDGEYAHNYKLTLSKYYFFGLIKKQVTINYKISMFGDLKQYFEHWDRLIFTKEKFKLKE